MRLRSFGSPSVLLLAVVLGLAGCAQVVRPSGVRDVGVDELASSLETPQAPIVIDARSPEEFEAGHVPGAINLPHDQIESRVHELDAYKGRSIVTYCEHGVRSAHAQRVLAAAGFTDIAQLTGNMPAWRASGRPTK